MSESRASMSSRAPVIFKKEFREIFRDKRTRTSVIIGPLIITPLMFAVIGKGIQGQVEQVEAEKTAVAVISSASTAGIESQLADTNKFAITKVQTEREAVQLIKDRKASVGLKIDPKIDERSASEQPIEITTIVDKGEQNSQIGMGKVFAFFQKRGAELAQERLQSRGVNPEVIAPYKLSEQSIPGGGGRAMLFLVQMLPYILIMASFSGAIYAAFDQVAGEKERGTLETLLVSPATRRDIVLAKFGAVVSVCIISSILSIVGLVIPFKSGLQAFDWIAKGGLTLDPMAMVAVVIVLLPLSVLFAGILLTLSTFAKNQKEAQTYLGTLFPIVIMPAMFSMFMGAKVALTVALIPVLNASLIIKQALNGNYNWPFIGLAFFASVAYAGIALAFATRMFQDEKVLIKT